MHFVHYVVIVIRGVARLRVPTNGYLFEIAMSLYLDDYRKRRRQKRGGSDYPSPHDAVADSDAERCEHPLERLADQDLDEENYPDLAAMQGSSSAQPRWSAEYASIDPTRTLEDEEYFERFYAYLRAPVDAAELAFEAARRGGGALAEQRKRDSLAQKFSRTMARSTLPSSHISFLPTTPVFSSSRSPSSWRRRNCRFSAMCATRAPRRCGWCWSRRPAAWNRT